MVTAQFLSEKYAKESTRKFRSVKGVLSRLKKTAAAGLTKAEIPVTSKSMSEISQTLKQAGFTVVETETKLTVVWH